MNGGLGLSGATKRVAEHARAFVRLELELAQTEIKKKLAQLGAGLGVTGAAALFAFLSLCFGLAAAAAGLATTLPVWASLLIVCGGLFLLAAILGLVGVALLKRGAKAVPEQAIAEAQTTTEALRNGH